MMVSIVDQIACAVRHVGVDYLVDDAAPEELTK